MGKTLYEKNSSFRIWMDRMDMVAHELTGCSIVDTLYNNGHTISDVFDTPQVSNPALFMVQYALAQVLIEQEIIPDLTLGTSAGAFVAAAVAGHLDMEDALCGAIMQAKLIAQHSPQGGLIAILASPELHEHLNMRNVSEIAAVNFANHFVVAAKTENLAEVQNFLCSQQINFHRLPVKQAYHSRWIDETTSHHHDYFRSLTYKPAKIPMVCCARSEITNAITSDHFWNVARAPIHFQQTIAKLELSGAYYYVDIGPTGTLSTFLKYLLPLKSVSRACAVVSPFGHRLEDFLCEYRTFVASCTAA
jgi:acyl transferase domain-containing protein